MSNPSRRFACFVLFALILAMVAFGSTPVLAGSSKVELYMTSWCPYCKKAAAFLRSRNIPFAEYDIEKDSDAARRYLGYGKGGVPLAVINGQVVHGFSETSYLKALGVGETQRPGAKPKIVTAP